MAGWDTDIAIRKTIADYVQIKDAALRHIEDARRSLDMASGVLNTAASYLMPRDTQLPSEEQCREEVNRGLWKKVFHLTGLLQLMDAQAIKDFEQSLSRECPDFTEENITATFLAQAQQADVMFRRGIVNVFRYLSHQYKTNKAEPFRIGQKFVMSWGCEAAWSGGRRIRYGAESKINDIDRVFCVLDNKRHNPATLESGMNRAFGKCGDFENDYFKVRSFKNGNLHWTIKRPDLLDEINLLIAKHYGEHALAET